jgi:hypothetical protein
MRRKCSNRTLRFVLKPAYPAGYHALFDPVEQQGHTALNRSKKSYKWAIPKELDWRNLTSSSHRARRTLSSKVGSTTAIGSVGVAGVGSDRWAAGGRLLRHRAVAVAEEGLPARSASVLDRGGDDEDLEDREGLEGMTTFGELLEDAGILGCGGCD